MNSSPNASSRAVLRGASAAQAVTFTPDALSDLPPIVAPVASDEDHGAVAAEVDDAFSAVALRAEPTLTDVVAHGRATAATSTEVAAPDAGRARVSFDAVYAEQMDAMREQARREGFEAGRAEGMSAAQQVIDEMVAEERASVRAEQEAWRTRAQATLSALAASAADLDARTAPVMAEMTDSLADAAYTLVHDLFDRELAVAVEPGRDAVERALRLIPLDAPVVVRMNPADHAGLDPEWMALLDGRIALVADPAVEAAGAVAESGARRVDAQLSSALTRVREVLSQ